MSIKRYTLNNLIGKLLSISIPRIQQYYSTRLVVTSQSGSRSTERIGRGRAGKRSLMSLFGGRTCKKLKTPCPSSRGRLRQQKTKKNRNQTQGTEARRRTRVAHGCGWKLESKLFRTLMPASTTNRRATIPPGPGCFLQPLLRPRKNRVEKQHFFSTLELPTLLSVAIETQFRALERFAEQFIIARSSVDIMAGSTFDIPVEKRKIRIGVRGARIMALYAA